MFEYDSYPKALAKTFGLSLAATAGMFIGVAIAGVIVTELKAREVNKTFTEIVDNSLLD